ncbi:HAD-IIB family hydrolase [Pseudomonadota bacterium]
MTARLLLCTDLDRTLLPNGTQPESPLARKLFSRFVAQPHVSLVYVTGRHRLLVEKAIKNYELPVPDAVISDVGTRIYSVHAGDWQERHDWQAEIATDWRGMSHAELQALFGDIKVLQKQEIEKQNTYKLSYYVPLFVDQEELLVEMQQYLDSREVDASLVWSIDEPAGIGLLDVLPKHATKLHAIEFLKEHMGYSDGETVFCGDSGNDLAVLSSTLPAVLVANAAQEVRDTALAEAAAAGNREALYCALGNFANMNGNYSAGILEGVVHYHPEFRAGILADEEALLCQS